MLYKIQHDTLGFSSYLLGTMHSRDNRAFTFYEASVQALGKCEHYAGEMNLGELDHSAFQAAFTLEDHKNLLDHIGERHYQRYRDIIFKAFHLDLNPLSHFKPIFIHGMLSEQCLNKERPISLDYQLYQDAVAMHKSVSGVETQNEQIDIASKINLKSQLLMLKSSVRNVSAFRNQVVSIANMYASGNTLGIFQKSSKNLYGMKSLMLTERNIRMADRIELICREQASFISIGAGHLSGSMGVLRLLKKKDYKIVELS